MAARKTTKQPEPQPEIGIINIGLDIGFGFTKAVGYGNPVVFPSVCGYAHDLGFKADEITAKYPGDQLSDNEAEWFIGELAESQLIEGEQLSLRGRTEDEADFRVRMTKAALGKMFPGLRNGDVVHVKISTGLPVSFMGDAPALKQALIGQHRIKTDQTDFTANVVSVYVMPQPYGTIYANSLTAAGEDDPCYVHDMTGVIDVGTYTIDLALDHNGEFLSRRSGSAEAGVYVVHEHIRTMFEAEKRAKLTEKQVRELVDTGCIKWKGKQENWVAVVEEAKERLRAATMNLIRKTWQLSGDIDVIHVSGGGADLVIDAVMAEYPQARLVTLPQIANATGYWRYAKSMELD